MGTFDEIFPELAVDMVELFAGDGLVTITEETGGFDFREDETLSKPVTYQVPGTAPLEYTAKELNAELNIIKGDAKIIVAAMHLEAKGLTGEPNPEKHKIIDGLGGNWTLVKTWAYPSGDLQTMYILQVRR